MMRSQFVMNQVLALAISLMSAQVFASEARDLPIVPKPKEVTLTGDSFALGGGVSVELYGVKKKAVATAYAQLEELYGRKGSASLLMGLPSDDKAFAALCGEAGLTVDETIGDEGYLLKIESDRILIAANTPAGLFYGVQSLVQLHRGRQAEESLPGLVLRDWPDYAHRMVSDDISRGPIPTREYMRQQVRRLAELKFNMLFYYTEHVVRTKSHPDFAPEGAPTVEEYEDLAEYARGYNLELVPNFQSFAHAEKVMQYSQYAFMGEADRVYSPAIPEVYDFVTDIYGELVDAHDSDLFVIHCDETFDLGRGSSKELVDSLGYDAVWAMHVNRLIDIVKSMGKRPVIWGDVPTNHPDVFDMLPKDILIGVWDYGPKESFAPFVDPVQSHGFDYLVVPGILNSRRLVPNWADARGNIRNFAAEGLEKGAWGILTTVWDDGGEAQFSRDWYGLAYAAEHSWHSDRSLTDEEFDKRFGPAVYGDESGGIAAALNTVNELAELPATAGMNRDVFWLDLLPERGRSISLNLDGMETVLERVGRAHEQLESAKPSIEAQDLAYIRYTIDQYKHLAQSRYDLSSAAQDYRDAAELQIKKRKAAKKKVLEALGGVQAVRQREEKLLDDYITLWNTENEPYALEWITEDYSRRITGYRDAERRLQNAIDLLDRKEYLPPITEVRLAIDVVSGNYMQGWLMCGPFPKETPDDQPAKDFLVNIGGEETVNPQVAMEFKAPDGSTYRWFKHQSPTYGEVDLVGLFERHEEAVVYATARITSPKAQRVRATFGSNDGIELLLNNERVYTWHGKRALVRDGDEVWLDLKEGQNVLILKVDQNKGGWGFSFQLPDVKLASRNFRYTLLDD